MPYHFCAAQNALGSQWLANRNVPCSPCFGLKNITDYAVDSKIQVLLSGPVEYSIFSLAPSQLDVLIFLSFSPVFTTPSGGIRYSWRKFRDLQGKYSPAIADGISRTWHRLSDQWLRWHMNQNHHLDRGLW